MSTIYKSLLAISRNGSKYLKLGLWSLFSLEELSVHTKNSIIPSGTFCQIRSHNIVNWFVVITNISRLIYIFTTTVTMGCLQSRNKEVSNSQKSSTAQGETAAQSNSTAQGESNTQETSTESPASQKKSTRNDNYDHLENFPVRDDEAEVTGGGESSANNNTCNAGGDNDNEGNGDCGDTSGGGDDGYAGGGGDIDGGCDDGDAGDFGGDDGD